GPCMGKFTCTATAIADLLVRLEAPGYALRLTQRSSQTCRQYPARESTVSCAFNPLGWGTSQRATPSGQPRITVVSGGRVVARGGAEETRYAGTPATATASGRRSRTRGVSLSPPAPSPSLLSSSALAVARPTRLVTPMLRDVSGGSSAAESPAAASTR